MRIFSIKKASAIAVVVLGMALAGNGYTRERVKAIEKAAAIERVAADYSQETGQAGIVLPALESAQKSAERLKTEKGVAAKTGGQLIFLEDANFELTPVRHGGESRPGDIAACERERDYCISHRCPPTGRDGSRTCRNQCKAEFGWCIERANHRSRCDSELDYCINHRCPPTGRDGSRTCRNACKEEHRRCQGW